MAAPHHLAARASGESGSGSYGYSACLHLIPASAMAASAPITTTPSPSYAPSLDDLRVTFSALHPSYTWGTAQGMACPFEEPCSPRWQPGSISWGTPWLCSSGFGPRQSEWIAFVYEQAKIMAKEAGIQFEEVGQMSQDPFRRLWVMQNSYQQFCRNPAMTMSARLEREKQRELVRQREEARKQAAERQRLIAAEKAKQEAENRAKAAAQHALEMAQAKEWAAQKIQEEKVAPERLAAQRELAELFTPQPPLPAAAEYRAQDWMTKARFRAMRAEAGFPLNADQHVCHIIAESNGGANHIDNYYVAAGSLNQSLGNRNDSYLAEAAGLEQTKKAVAVSRTRGYTGPDAEDLIAMAKAARTGMSAGAAASPPQGGAVYYDQVTPQQQAQLSAWHREALESQRRAAQEQYESSTFTRRERILRGTW